MHMHWKGRGRRLGERSIHWNMKRAKTKAIMCMHAIGTNPNILAQSEPQRKKRKTVSAAHRVLMAEEQVTQREEKQAVTS